MVFSDLYCTRYVMFVSPAQKHNARSFFNHTLCYCLDPNLWVLRPFGVLLELEAPAALDWLLILTVRRRCVGLVLCSWSCREGVEVEYVR